LLWCDAVMVYVAALDCFSRYDPSITLVGAVADDNRDLVLDGVLVRAFHGMVAAISRRSSISYSAPWRMQSFNQGLLRAKTR